MLDESGDDCPSTPASGARYRHVWAGNLRTGKYLPANPDGGTAIEPDTIGTWVVHEIGSFGLDATSSTREDGTWQMSVRRAGDVPGTKDPSRP